ncbi:MAG: hypothetical protein AAB389_00200 [Patescibacteria group bacterium]
MWRNVFAGVVVVGMVIGLSWMIGTTWSTHSLNSAYAEEPSGVGKDDVEVKDLGSGVYRVDVKTSSDSREDYEVALVKFCKEHADCVVSVSSAPMNQKGNTGVSTYYWVTSKK